MSTVSDVTTYTNSMTEKELQEAIIKEARTLGWLVYHTFDARRSEEGFPDLILLHETTGRRLALEVKTAKGRVSAAQQDWLRAFVNCGIPAAVVRPCDRDHLREWLR